MTDPNQELVELLKRATKTTHSEIDWYSSLFPELAECLALAERNAEANRWVPVSERLPDTVEFPPETEFEVWDGEHRYLAEFGDHGWFGTESGMRIRDVLFWRVPTPPPEGT